MNDRCGECRYLMRKPEHEKEMGQDARFCINQRRMDAYLPDLIYEDDKACRFWEAKEGDQDE